MKELSTEEKARLYNEAYKRVATRFGTNVANEIFQELKENEDEKMKRVLTEGFAILSKDEEWYDGVTVGQILTWLEKQSKASKVEEAMREVEEKATAFTEAHKGETSEEILAQMRVEQNPAWSEEDEVNLSRAIWYAENPAPSTVKNTMLVEWLKSLKERVLPRPQQEWSEEDEKIISIILSICDDFKRSFEISPASSNTVQKDIDKINNWLKSLKDRYTWKPSEEQMEALSAINVTGGISYAGQAQELINLYQDLKKLKEE